MSAGAGAAAAAAAELMRQEEEEMTGYSGKELAEGWEFKILRSNFGSFRKPEKLQAALDAEKRGGWILVEKFDNNRIRLKRPAATKVIVGDFSDGYDPYRTEYGTGDAKTVAIILGAVFGVLGVFLAVLLFLSRH